MIYAPRREADGEPSDNHIMIIIIIIVIVIINY